MKDNNRQGHHHGRNPRGFEPHSRDRGSVDVRRGRGWRFNAGARYFDPYEPHYRMTARTPALNGKHIRSVGEPVRATHGKAL